MFATLAGGRKFTKLDLTQAYTQLELEEGVRGVSYYKYPFRPFPLQTVSIWYKFSTCNFPICYGPDFSWFIKCSVKN